MTIAGPGEITFSNFASSGPFFFNRICGEERILSFFSLNAFFFPFGSELFGAANS